MKTCGRCGASYESVSNLPSLQRFSPNELSPHVMRWPANVAVEVRQCTRCDHPIACLRPLGSG